MKPHRLSVLTFLIGAVAVAQCCPGYLTGLVTDASGAPIANAAVYLHCKARKPSESDRDVTVRTDSTGKYNAGQLPWEPCNVDFSAQGFAAVHKMVTPMIDTSITLDIKMEASRNN